MSWHERMAANLAQSGHKNNGTQKANHFCFSALNSHLVRGIEECMRKWVSSLCSIRSEAAINLLLIFQMCSTFGRFFDVRARPKRSLPRSAKCNPQICFTENTDALDSWSWIMSISRIFNFPREHIACALFLLSPPLIGRAYVRFSLECIWYVLPRVCADINPSDIPSFSLSVFRIHQCHRRTLL